MAANIEVVFGCPKSPKYRWKASSVSEAIRLMNCYITCQHYERGCRPVECIDPKKGSKARDRKGATK